MDFTGVILSQNLRIVKSWKKVLVCASLLKKNISLNVELNSLFVELKLCAQTEAEFNKCDSNITW